MEIEQLLKLLEGKESHSKRVIIIILNIQMNDPIDFRPLCSVNPRQESLSIPAAGLAALPWRSQSKAESPTSYPPMSLHPLWGCNFPSFLSLSGHSIQRILAEKCISLKIPLYWVQGEEPWEIFPLVCRVWGESLSHSWGCKKTFCGKGQKQAGHQRGFSSAHDSRVI